MTAIRLQRYLSQAGVAARRKAEVLITSGVVTVNGETVTELGSKVVPGRDRVCVDGKAVYPQDLFYAVLNKPKACITAVSDPDGRMTVMDYLHNVPVAIAPVGRLDYYSEGVLLLTNDGQLSARLQSPDYHVEKTYHVKIRGEVEERDIAALRRGVRLDDGTVTREAQIDTRKSKSRHQWLVVTLTEGKSRQIHRMFAALGYTVLKLQRVAYGAITYHGLRVGDSRELTQVEVNQLRQAVGLSKDTVSRGTWQSRREETELGRRARERARNRAEALDGDRGQAGDDTGTRPARGDDRRGGARRTGPGKGPGVGGKAGSGGTGRRAGPGRGAGRGTRGKTAGTSRGKASGGARGKAPGKTAGGARGKASGGTRGKAPGKAPGGARGKAPGKTSGGARGKAPGKTSSKPRGKAPGKASGKPRGKAPGKAAGGPPGKAAGRERSGSSSGRAPARSGARGAKSSRSDRPARAGRPGKPAAKRKRR